MSLIIETGFVVPNANSYVTIAEARAFAIARGVTLSAVDTVVEKNCIIAIDYLESFRNRFKGYKIGFAQGLQFPRVSILIDNYWLGYNTIPPMLKNAQCQLVIELHNGIDLTPSAADGKFLVREKIDVIENEWAHGGSMLPTLTKFEQFLAPLLKPSTGGLITHRA